MNVYLDSEFIEGKQKRSWWQQLLCFLAGIKNKPTVDIISIGIVGDDGWEYYAISKDFNLKEAWYRWQWSETGKLDLPGIVRSRVKEYWIRENVLKPIWQELDYKEYREDPNDIKQEFYDILDELPEEQRLSFYVKNMLPYSLERFTLGRLRQLIEKYGKINTHIVQDIMQFVCPGFAVSDDYAINGIGSIDSGLIAYLKENQPIFYGYFADYDWVVFCWLFGKMTSLPKGFPYYCRDLKQMLDEKASDLTSLGFKDIVELKDRSKNISDLTPDEGIKVLKSHSKYPKQVNEHSAIFDAKWNKQLHEFIKSL